MNKEEPAEIEITQTNNSPRSNESFVIVEGANGITPIRQHSVMLATNGGLAKSGSFKADDNIKQIAR